MCADSVNLEEQCEDALFELCDARERYPMKCSEELGRCVRLISDIEMQPPKLKAPTKIAEIVISNEESALFDEIVPFKANEKKNEWGLMLDKVKDLQKILDQIKT